VERSDKQKIDDYVKTLKAANKVFSTPEGLILLEYIVSATGVFSSNHPYKDEGSNALRNFGAGVLHLAGMQRGDVVPDVIKGIVLKATDTDPDDLRASVEEYLRSSGEIS
jgi:hypothetical protein